MENKSHALAAGSFVLLVTAIVIALATWLSRDTTLRDVYELSTRESITGLSPQAAVRYRGISVGKVEAIEFDKAVKGNVLVRLSIDGQAPLTKSTYATLGFQGVTGLAYVLLDEDGPSNEPLTTSFLQPTRIPLRPNLFSSITDQGTRLLMQAEKTSELLNQLLSPGNQKVLLGAVQSAGESAAKIGAMSQRMQTIADAQFGPERSNIPAMVKNISTNMLAMQTTSADLSQTAKDTSRAANAAAEAVATMSGKITEKGGVLDQVSAGSAALAQSAQTLSASTLPRAARAVDDTAKAVRNADRVLGSIGDNPQSLLYGNGATPPGPGENGFVPPAATAPAR
jgi:phospholipid/cholesterol/gamma-HCH transport system substrate-binding protein